MIKTAEIIAEKLKGLIFKSELYKAGLFDDYKGEKVFYCKITGNVIELNDVLETTEAECLTLEKTNDEYEQLGIDYFDSSGTFLVDDIKELKEVSEQFNKFDSRA